MTRALVATCGVLNSDDGNASPAVAVEIVRINLRRDMAKSSAGASRLSDWAAVDAAWRRSLPSGVCAIMELVCLAASLLFCATDFNARFAYAVSNLPLVLKFLRMFWELCVFFPVEK